MHESRGQNASQMPKVSKSRLMYDHLLLKSSWNKKGFNDVTAALFSVFFAAGSWEKDTKNRAAVTSLSSFLFCDDFITYAMYGHLWPIFTGIAFKKLLPVGWSFDFFVMLKNWLRFVFCPALAWFFLVKCVSNGLISSNMTWQFQIFPQNWNWMVQKEG